jgi:hypothetical protein
LDTTVTGVVPSPARPVGATRRVDLLARREVLEDIPNDSAAALLLIEHHWAVPLRDAIARAGGFRITDGFISPLDLAEIGLVTADEPKQLHAMETATAGSAN